MAENLGEKISGSNIQVIYERYGDEWITPAEWMQRKFEARIRNGFAGIEEVSSDNEEIKKLVDYRNQLNQNFDLIHQPVGLSTGIAKSYLARIPSEDLKPEFDHLILRLRGETEYLEELEDVGIAAGLLAGLEKGRYGSLVKFFAPDTLVAKVMRKKGIGGAYLPLLDLVVFPDKPPTVEEMWLSMANEGKLPKLIFNLDHELTHDKQYTKMQKALLHLPGLSRAVGYQTILSRYGLIPALSFMVSTYHLAKKLRANFTNDEILSEIHAFEAMASNPGFNDEGLDERGEIAGFVAGYYGDLDSDFLAANKAFNLIRGLRVMGLDDKAIGRLVSQTRFDEDKQTYPKLEKRLKKEQEHWGIEREEDYYRVRRALLSRQELELHVQRHYARRISAEQLKIASGKGGWVN